MNFPELHRLNRNQKQFAIQVLKTRPPEERAAPLSRLVVDDDPVVRGRAALAMKGCPSESLLEGARILIQSNEPGRIILALELLGFTRDAPLFPLLEPVSNHDDIRVRKALLEILDRLSVQPGVELFRRTLDGVELPALWTSLGRLLERWNPRMLWPDLKDAYSSLDSPQRRAEWLRLVLQNPHPKVDEFVRKELTSSAVPGEHREMLKAALLLQ